MNKILEKEEDLRPMLSELLTTETVQVLPEVADWRAGITEAAKPLLKNGSITEKYIDAMIQKVESFGNLSISVRRSIASCAARRWR